MVWGAIISGVASIAGGLLKKKGAKDAANAQESAAQAGVDEIKRQFDLARSDLQPFVAPGADALGSLTQGSQIGGLDARLSGILNSESFNNLRDQRLQSLNSSQGQRGLLRSGQGLEEIANLDTDLALQLENQLYGRSSNLAANAQAAAAGQAGQALQAGQSVAELRTQQGNAQAAGIIGQSNAINEGIGGVGEILAKYYAEK